MYIESPQNARIRAWSRLKDKRGRQQSGEFLVEGVRLVEELLRSTLETVAVVWDVGTDELPDTLTEAAMERGVPLLEASPGAFAVLSDTVTPQGVLAVARMPLTAQTPAPPDQVLVLDGVQDPGNVGTLLRSADAFRMGQVCCGRGTVDPFAPKVVRASMGGLFRVPVVSADTVAYLQTWRTRWPDGQIVHARAHAEAACHELNFRRPTLLLVGSEASGVSPEAASLADTQVRIPMSEAAESLNAAVAGSILLYEMFRQRT